MTPEPVAHSGPLSRLTRSLVAENVHMSVYRDIVQSTEGATHDFLVVRRSPFVVVVPVLPDGRLLLIRQARYAARIRLLELPQGAMEPGEGLIKAAARELLEETGYTATEPAVLRRRLYEAADWAEHCFGVVAVKALPPAGAGGPCAERGIDVVPTRTAEVDTLIADGAVRDAASLAALLCHRVHRRP